MYGRCFRVKKEIGEQVKQFLLSKDWLDRGKIIGGSALRYLLFALTENANVDELKKRFKGSLEQRNLPAIEKKGAKNLREVLAKIVPAEKLEEMNRSFDVIGDILVLEIPDSLEKLEPSIGWNLKRAYPNIKVVAKKGKKTEGEFRIRKVKILAGEQRTETLHREAGMTLKVDLNKVYFSSRMGSERLRVLQQIKNGENILVMFAGIGPYAILFAKDRKVQVTAIELNPDAVKLMNENIRVNYVGDKIQVLEGDVHKVAPKLKEKFDRIVMPLPALAHEFLADALSVSKKGTIIHLYQFSHEKKVEEIKARALKLAAKAGRNIKILRVVQTGYYSPYVNRYCLDIEVL